MTATPPAIHRRTMRKDALRDAVVLIIAVTKYCGKKIKFK